MGCHVRIFSIAFLLLVVMSLSVSTANAQYRASIQGVVTDPAGAVDAAVVIGSRRIVARKEARFAAISR